jgi:hypothetical protein
LIVLISPLNGLSSFQFSLFGEEPFQDFGGETLGIRVFAWMVVYGALSGLFGVTQQLLERLHLAPEGTHLAF